MTFNELLTEFQNTFDSEEMLGILDEMEAVAETMEEKEAVESLRSVILA